MADHAAEILLQAEVPFYQRGNKLVRPVVVAAQTFYGKPTRVAQVVEVELPYLRDMLCRKSRAQDRLRKLNDDAVLVRADLESITEAIAEATALVAAAQRAEALQQDRAQAEQLKAKLAAFIEHGTNADDALWDAGQSIKAMIDLLREMHALGQAAPTSEQLRVNGSNAVKTMLQELPQLWLRDFEFQLLAPGQKKRFKDLCVGWQAMIERDIATRLGEHKEEAA